MYFVGLYYNRNFSDAKISPCLALGVTVVLQCVAVVSNLGALQCVVVNCSVL